MDAIPETSAEPQNGGAEGISDFRWKLYSVPWYDRVMVCCFRVRSNPSPGVLRFPLHAPQEQAKKVRPPND